MNKSLVSDVTAERPHPFNQGIAATRGKTMGASRFARMLNPA
jgi:hypothetical protein